jgi:DNA-binding CsgD family transcriptional regulator
MEEQQAEELHEKATSEGPKDALARGRAAYERRAWKDAYELLSSADRTAPLDARDLELLATSAYMLGRDNEYLSVLERAHHAYVEAGETLRAFRCAFWVGITHALRGEMGPAGGWLGRAHGLVGEEDSVARGYLLVPLVFEHEAAGDFTAAAAVAADAAALAKRFGEAEGYALTVQAQGSMLIKAGRVKEGLALLDEAMVTVAGGQLSPIATGLVYCGVILACQEAHEVRRAQEWTAVLTRWCDDQPDLVAFTGRCLVHRAELMQFHGDWNDALREARRAGERLAQSFNRAAAAQAFYRRGELYRLRGELDEAEEAYREASRYGWEPQPGFALLRLAQGKGRAAASAIARALAESVEPLRRASLLPASVEISLATGEVREARRACDELEVISERFESDLFRAIVSTAEGAVKLAEGEFRGALVELRGAWTSWQKLEAPYEGARTRELIGLACRAAGDDDSAALELGAARHVFAELEAASDLRRVEKHLSPATPGSALGLTPREAEVLVLVAAGKSNRTIATELFISEKTVARHISNIFTKLGLSSRAAATAYAYEHELV